MPDSYPINVTILDTVTGQRVVYRDQGWDDEYEAPGTFADYIWRDGNFSCDCNRATFFRLAAGIEPTDDEECGDSRYVVESIVRLSDGAMVYADDHHTRASVPVE